VREVAALELPARVLEHDLAPALDADAGRARPVGHELRADRAELPVAASVLWCVALLTVAVPLTLRVYRARVEP
jgi:hypothetical protein